MERQAITVGGVVQGVWFRPFVYGLASRLRLSGSPLKGVFALSLAHFICVTSRGPGVPRRRGSRGEWLSRIRSTPVATRIACAAFHLSNAVPACLAAIPDVVPGKYVIVHVGFSLQAIAVARARAVKSLPRTQPIGRIS